MKPKITPQSELKMIRVLPDDHKWLMHESVESGQPLYGVVSDLVAIRRAMDEIRQGIRKQAEEEHQEG